MATAEAYFKNSYTVTIQGLPSSLLSSVASIEVNVIAVIEYLSDFVSWKGILDFVVNVEPNGGALLPASAFGGIASNGNTFAADEALTGIDANGTQFDIGANIPIDSSGVLVSRADPFEFDPNPDGYEIYEDSYPGRDFFSVFLHEALHGLGFWSYAQHNRDDLVDTTFDTFTEQRGGQFFFVGQNVLQVLGEALPLSLENRDHYTDIGEKPIDTGVMYQGSDGFGSFERWHLGQLDLAVLRDLGFHTANESLLPLVGGPDDEVNRPGTPPPAWAADAASIEVVASTYQFFTDHVPTAEGFEYLISSTANSTDLNDAYYARFNTENRFINFASNLGTAGEGASSFDARFGSLNFEQTVKTAYLEVMGSDLTGAALDFFLNAQTFYRAVALERVVRPGVDLAEATKIVAVGSLLNEANKLGSGSYADAIEGLVADVAPDGLSALLGGDLFAVA